MNLTQFTRDQITMAVRYILIMAGGYLVKQGILDETSMTLIAGGLAIAFGAIAWGFINRRPVAAIASVASLSNVERVVTDRTTANVTLQGNDKVVSDR